MKQKITKTLIGAMFIFAFVFGFCHAVKAQKVETLVIYENFGGADAGSSVPGIQPDKWPDVNSGRVKNTADSTAAGIANNTRCRWCATPQNLDNKGNNVSVPQFAGNTFFQIDSMIKYRDGGLDGLDITVDNNSKKWIKTVPLRNGYTMPFSGKTTLDFSFLGIACLPELMSWISYAPYTPSYLKNQTDEKGYIYFGKNIYPSNQRPILAIPADPIDALENITKLELLISGSRLGNNNTVSVAIEEQDESGNILGIKTLTYSVSIEPRLITVPVNRTYCRIYIQTWGAANNSNVSDFALLNGNTDIDGSTTYNYNAIACTKPDGTASAGQTGNPGIQLHMIKAYALINGSYTITTNNSLVSGTTSGISHGQTIQLTAQALNGANKFMGWKISGRPDLSEVVNPLNIEVTKDMTIMPVYAGDMAEVAVVNENFTNWPQYGKLDATKNNLLIYANTPTATQDTITKTIKVPLRYGFTSGGKDSVNIYIKNCNVIPQYGLRIFDLPGWEKYIGYVAFMGPNASKGYLSVGTLENITKAEVDVSSYDLPAPDRACAIKVNGTYVRNKMLPTLYPQNIVYTNNPSTPINFQVGPGNQARCEYLDSASAAAGITTQINAAAVALHNLKMYANITMPAKNYYQIVIPSFAGGNITGMVPSSGNSTNHFMEGTKVSIGAAPTLGFGFDGWVDGNDNPLGNDNPIVLTMDADKTIKPIFAQNPSYVKIIANTNGTISSNIEPQAKKADTLTFLAGVSVTLTATPKYGFAFNKWTINGKDTIPTSNKNILILSVQRMIKNATLVLTVTYDSISTRSTLTVNNNLTQGSVKYNHNPENIVSNTTIQTCQFPTGVNIEATAEHAYGFVFNSWVSKLAIANADTLKNPATIAMTTDKSIATRWDTAPRRLLIIRSGYNGSISITDSHKDGYYELKGRWPANYDVQLTAVPAAGFVLSGIGDTASGIIVSDNLITVNMDRDTVIVRPEFAKRIDGVVLALSENFQDGTRWPENPGTVSNVPGVINFLGLSSDWDPRIYTNKIEDLLTILAPYRTWGSQSNDNSDGPNGTKNPRTTLNLVYSKPPITRLITIPQSNRHVKVTVANYAPCNNCVIGKAVKLGYINNQLLGHVSPGFMALKKINPTPARSTTLKPFLRNDTIGMLMVEGLALVEKLEIGYVSGGTQYCPGVFYEIDGIPLISSTGVFDALYGDIYIKGQVTRPSYTPYEGKYGWGSSQEGMKMNQNLYINEEGVPETKILITSGFKNTGTTYAYSDIYIHDLNVWGMPTILDPVSVKELVEETQKTGSKFYILGNTNMLKVAVSEQIKSLVIYDMNGKAVKVLHSNSTENLFDVSSLKLGIYAAYAYGRSGKQYKGSFGKTE